MVVALIVSAFIWVVGQALGAVFGGQSTDVNSGPLLAIIALAYWPTRPATTIAKTTGADNMIGPTWLAAILGVVMMVAAIVAIVRIITAVRTRTATDYEVDIHNVVMGVSMAGMLIPALLIVTPGASTAAWIVVWIVITVWFAISVIRDAIRRRSGGRFTGHHLPTWSCPGR